MTLCWGRRSKLVVWARAQQRGIFAAGFFKMERKDAKSCPLCCVLLVYAASIFSHDSASFDVGGGVFGCFGGNQSKKYYTTILS